MVSIFIQIAIVIVAGFISAALAPKPQPPKPAGLADVDAPTAEEGKAIPVIFGTVWLASPNVVWYGDLRTSPIRKAGGKK